MAVTLAKPFKFLVLAYLIGVFFFRQVLADSGKSPKAVFPQEKTVDLFRVIFPQGQDCINAADREFIGKTVTHKENITYNKSVTNG
jgi:hypothetical protein